MFIVGVIAFSHDALFGYVYLSSMNHYLLDVLHSGAGLPAFAIALGGVAAVLAQPISGSLLDRSGPRTLLLVILGTDSAGLCLMLGVNNQAGFLSGALLLAMGISAIWPLAFSIMRQSQPESGRAASGLVLTAAGITGTSFGLVAGLTASALLSWRLTFFVAFVPVAVSALTLFSQVLSGSAPVTKTIGLRPPIPRMLQLGFVIFVNHAAVSALLGLFGPFLRRTLGVSLETGLVLLLPAGALALTAVSASARVSRSYRRLPEIGFLFAISAVGAVLLALSASPVAAACAAPLLLVGLGSVEPVVNAAILDAGGGANPGRAFGTLLTFQQSGVIAGPAAIGLVTQLSNPRWGLVVTALILSGGTVVALSGRRSG